MATPLSPWSIAGSGTAWHRLSWLFRVRRFWSEWRRSLARRAAQAARRRHERSQAAAAQACAEEGADVEFGCIELDGRRYGALYRHGTLVCLLPELDRL